MCNEPFCPERLKVALFYLSSLAPKFFTAKSRVVKQRFFSVSRDNMAALWIKAHRLEERLEIS